MAEKRRRDGLREARASSIASHIMSNNKKDQGTHIEDECILLSELGGRNDVFRLSRKPGCNLITLG
jgi:hypothetical protein